LLVSRAGEVLHLMSYGMAVVTPKRLPMRLNTMFDLASLTKPIVAVALMTLWERGKVNLHDRVCEYVPELSASEKRSITLWHLLTHTSGLPAWAPLYRMCESPEEVFRVIAKLEPEARAGARVVYSDLNFMLLGRVVEVASGVPLDAYLRESVLEPLGMSSTMYNPPPKLRELTAATELCKWRGRVIWGEVHDENAYFMGGVSGHAGLFSTALDLYRFSSMMLSGGSLRGARVLSSDTVELMTENHTRGLNSARGLGWALREDGWQGGELMSDKAYGHTGFTGTSLFVDPEREAAVVMLTNRIHPSRENEMILEARPAIHDAVLSILDCLG